MGLSITSVALPTKYRFMLALWCFPFLIQRKGWDTHRNDGIYNSQHNSRRDTHFQSGSCQKGAGIAAVHILFWERCYFLCSENNHKHQDPLCFLPFWITESWRLGRPLSSPSPTPTHPHHAHSPCPSVPHLHSSWISPQLLFSLFLSVEKTKRAHARDPGEKQRSKYRLRKPKITAETVIFPKIDFDFHWAFQWNTKIYRERKLIIFGL